MRKIKLLRNNDNKDWSDLEWITEFYEFMQGDIPEGIGLGGTEMNLTQDQAFTIIWYLQEHFSILPDNIEKCSDCGERYDVDSGGEYMEIEGKHYCGGCIDNSEATYCYGCGREMYKNEVDRGEDYYCEKCRLANDNHSLLTNKE